MQWKKVGCQRRMQHWKIGCKYKGGMQVWDDTKGKMQV